MQIWWRKCTARDSEKLYTSAKAIVYSKKATHVIALIHRGRNPAICISKGVKLSHPGSTIHPVPSSFGREPGTTTPAFSIVVPTRNRSQLLERTLAGLRSQTFLAFEVVVIDDGSNEATRALYPVIWENLDQRFVLLSHGEADALGIGPSAARNVGIAAATGPIIAFCDDDDIWTNDNHLAMMMAAFSDNPSLDMYIANQIAVTTEGVVTKDSWFPGLEAIVQRRSRSLEHGYMVTRDDLASCGAFAQLNILTIKKNLIDSMGGFWTRTPYEGDRDFFWRAVDLADQIFFNPTIIAQHNIPDQTKHDNVSTRVTEVERWILSTFVSQHISLSVRHHTIKNLCNHYEGDILRHLSLYFSNHNEHDLGYQYARRALATRLSWKWSAYTLMLACRGLLRRLAR